MTTPARSRMVASAAQLLRERGFNGTGMREVAAHAEAPRGSLQHYFPNGKDQLVAEALALITQQVSAPLERLAHASPPASARVVVAKLFDHWRGLLTESDYLDGCPVVATITDSVANEALCAAAREAFDGWQASLTTALRRGGLTKVRAERMAVLVISSLEGAIVMCRAQRDLCSLDTVAAELDRLLRS